MMEESHGPSILGALWRYKWSSMLIIVTALLISAGFAMVSAGKATASARIALATPSSTVLTGTNAQTEPTFVRYVNQRAIFATSHRVLAAAATTLGAPATAETLRPAVTVKATSAGEAIVIRTQATTPRRAADMANAVLTAYVDLSRSDVKAAAKSALDSIAERRKALLASGASAASQAVVALDEQTTQIQLDTAQFGSGVSFVNNASAASASKPGMSPVDLGLGIIVGLLVAGTVAWLRADRDRRISSLDDVPVAIEAPLLGEVAEVEAARRGELSIPAGAPHAVFNSVVSGVQARFSSGVLLVSSAEAGEGRSTTALNVAAGLARAGVRVALVDASLRSPDLSRMTGLHDVSVGLTAAMAGSSDLRHTIYALDIGGGSSIDVLPAGEHSRFFAGASRSTSIEPMLAELRGRYDVVIIDTEASIVSAEVASLARHSDGVVIVVRRGTNIRDVIQFTERLRLFEIDTVGYVYNAARAGTGRRQSTVNSNRGRGHTELLEPVAHGVSSTV
jgi:Mrp family chromosome partitioning ATPase